MAKADHYPHIVQYGQYALMNVGPFWWKANTKASGPFLHSDQDIVQLLLSFLLNSSSKKN